MSITPTKKSGLQTVGSCTRNWPKSTCGLVFEGGQDHDQIITTRKGTGGFNLKVTGVGAHAGNQHADGVNAIHALSLLVPRLEALTDYDEGTTVNVGVIHGGTSKNTVPEEANCSIDVRITSQDCADQVVNALKEIASNPFTDFENLPSKFAQVKVELTGAIRRPPMESSEASEALRASYENFASLEGLDIGRAPLQGGGSDANLLAAKGVPCIDGLGPYGKFMHSPKEWSSLSSLKQRTKALAGFLVNAQGI